MKYRRWDGRNMRLDTFWKPLEADTPREALRILKAHALLYKQDLASYDIDEGEVVMKPHGTAMSQGFQYACYEQAITRRPWKMIGEDGTEICVDVSGYITVSEPEPKRAWSEDRLVDTNGNGAAHDDTDDDGLPF